MSVSPRINPLKERSGKSLEEERKKMRIEK